MPSRPRDAVASRQGLPWASSLAALGVIYGDIGTSPLYALRECFSGHPLVPSRANVLGVLSLVLWSLVLLIGVKYQLFVMRAHNRGEGGILALVALLRPRRAEGMRRGGLLLGLGLFGAALLYGDGMITPAISVLSAIEGLEITTTALRAYVVPLTIVVLLALFAFQRGGTARAGAVFGPVTLAWFVAIAALGLAAVFRGPEVLAAVNPYHAAAFFARNGATGFLVLGAVFLVVTGGEALYADMGHFGMRPIRMTWFGVVLPALLLNYFGQGALLLQDAGAADNPFYRLVPAWGIYPMIALATAATIVASQAVITGAFSLTRQAVQLGYSPRLAIVHTSRAEIGQIYVPGVNWALMLATIGLVLGFRSSANLAGAYGVAVTSTMAITTVLACAVARELWGWSLTRMLAVGALFLSVDLTFLGANLAKIADGGWFPLAIGLFLFILMTTWKRGRALLMDRLRRDMPTFETLLADVRAHPPVRVPGTAVFMTGSPHGIPSALIHNLKHNKILHERVVVLTVATEEVPYVTGHERVRVEHLGEGFSRVLVRYGYMEDPNVPDALRRCEGQGLACPPGETTFFLGRETLVVTPRSGMPFWRGRLFGVLSRNAHQPTAFFRLPPNRVVELGAQVEL
jgi:KUP system potassium uptake protein